MRQVGGSHYQGYKIEPSKFLIANEIPFAEGSVIKYVIRWRDKNGVEDLKKAIHYIEMLIEEYETSQKTE